MLIRLSRAALLIATFTIAPLSASAALLSYEPFNYPAAVEGLTGQNGGTGFDNAWTLPSGATNGPDVLATSLTYTDASGTPLPVTGGRALTDSTNPTAGATGETVTAFRSVAAAVGGISGSTLYLSFLAEQTQGTERFINLALYGTALQEIIAVGHSTSFSSNWGAYVNGTPGQGDYSTTPTEDLAFLVLRIDLNINVTNNDRFRLYVNPTLGIEPTTAAVDVADFDFLPSFAAIAQIRIGSGNSTSLLPASQMEIDEIRLADSYASAAPIPEPSAVALLAGTLALVALRRRRQR